MGNLTAIPAGAGVDGDGVRAGRSVVIDACVARLLGERLMSGSVGRRERVKGIVNGVFAGRGRFSLTLKSARQEEFGAAFADRFISMSPAVRSAR